jgi:voltage-gated potassium channel
VVENAKDREASMPPGTATPRPRPLSRRRFEARFRGRAERAIAGRHVFRYLASATLILSIAAAVTVWLIDRRDFPTLGEAFWWALQTLSTVGYGDVVPHTTWGRAVGSVVIVLGVTFLSFLTAMITSWFVSADQDERTAEVEALRGTEREDTQDKLDAILTRLDAIEETLKDIQTPR